ncbi:MAG: hypothetical protein J5I98_30540 [Phaeodactylibacter sp.]|nr:hypothetical protein [Phaeodactylibacter sp.]
MAIDGSSIGNGCMASMASLIWRRRAIPICWIVRRAPKGNFPQQMHLDIVNQVAMLLGAIIECPCQVILLGDAGFDGNELQQAYLSHGWDYVLKTGKDTLLADNPQWLPEKLFYALKKKRYSLFWVSISNWPGSGASSPPNR